MHCSPVPRAPCDDCKFRATCAESGLICEAFAAYVDGVTGRNSWQQLPRIPRKRLTGRVHKADAVLASDEATEVQKIEKRAYMRAWRDRNRERVRAQGRERLRRLKESDPQRLARMRERVRAWAKAHPESNRAASRRWAQRHREQVNERRRAHPESVAAARAWRLAHLEQCRAANRAWKVLHRNEVNAQRRARYAQDPSRTLEAARRRRAEHRERSSLQIQLAGARSAQNTTVHAPGLPAL
jgi:hypothetical protein